MVVAGSQQLDEAQVGHDGKGRRRVAESNINCCGSIVGWEENGKYLVRT